MAVKYFGAAAVLLGIGTGLGSCVKGCGEAIYKINVSKRVLQLQEADLNGNNIKEKFYVVDGKLALVEKDGKPVLEKIVQE